MLTEKDYKEISDDVYDVDAGKIENPVKVGDTVAGGKFHILKIEDNPNNGMQAMAVAPVDKNGQVDYSEVVIAYAGTNSGDALDLLTDAQQIGLGNDSLLIPTIGGVAVELETQADTALAFAQKVAKEVKQKKPQARITTTGHSLGESLALYVALKENYSNIGFNGPDIHQLLSEQEINYMKAHPEQFINYRHKYDGIGNITGDKTGTARYPKVYEERVDVFKTLDYHSLSGWEFTEDGRLADKEGRPASNYALEQVKGRVTAALSRLRSFQPQLAAGGYSAHETIFLDSTQSSLIMTGLSEAARAGADELSSYKKAALDLASQALDFIDFSSFTCLSVDELTAIFTSYGLTHDMVAADIEESLGPIVAKAEQLAVEFETLDSDVQAGIQAMLEADHTLAGDFDQWINQM